MHKKPTFSPFFDIQDHPPRLLGRNASVPVWALQVHYLQAIPFASKHQHFPYENCFNSPWTDSVRTLELQKCARVVSGSRGDPFPHPDLKREKRTPKP